MIVDDSFWRVLRFVLCIGFLGAFVAEVWAMLMRVMGVVIVSYGMFGRGMLGAFKGRRSLCESCEAVFPHRTPTHKPGFALRLTCQKRSCPFESQTSRSEKLLGAGLHFLYAVLCCALMVWLWGPEIIARPRIAPFLLISIVLKSLITFGLIVPALGYGVFARRHFNPVQVCGLLFVGYFFAAMAQYFAALAMV